jgi:hypothetical protein
MLTQTSLLTLASLFLLCALAAFAYTYHARPFQTPHRPDPTANAYQAALYREICTIRDILDRAGVPESFNRNPLLTSARVQMLADTAVADRDALCQLTIYLDQKGAPDELHGRALSPKERVHYLLTKQKVQRQ